MSVHHPVANVEVVNVLFNDMVAAQPDVMIPIPNLPLQIGRPAVAAMPDRTAVDPVRAQRDHVANGSDLKLLYGLDITRTMTPLIPSRDFQVLLLRQFTRFIHHATAGAIHGNWFFGENMLARFDRSLELCRLES